MKRNLIDFKSISEDFLNDVITFLLEGETFEIITDIIFNSNGTIKSAFKIALDDKTKIKKIEEVFDEIQVNKSNYTIWLYKNDLFIKDSYLVVMINKKDLKRYSSDKDVLFKPFLFYFIEKSISYIINNANNIALMSMIDKDEFVRKVTKDYLREVFNTIGAGYLVDEVFTVFSIISTQKYEKSRSEGFILFTNNSNLPMSVEFSKDIDIARRNYRTIRKLLEFSRNGNFPLIAVNGKIIGISEINYIDEKLLLVRFYENMWEVYIYDPFVNIKSKDILTLDMYNMRFYPLVRVKNGLPEIPRLKFDREYLKNILISTFKNIPDELLRRLIETVTSASRLGHGLIIIITTSNIAKMESNRLTYKSFQIKPFSLFENNKLNIELLRSITSIDGAIIIDLDGICYGVGVILDGDISGVENPSRGARYNSSLRYIETRNNEAVAIVISDDGMVDIISNDMIQEKKIIGISETFIEDTKSFIS
jgi:hypothetical protein